MLARLTQYAARVKPFFSAVFAPHTMRNPRHAGYLSSFLLNYIYLTIDFCFIFFSKYRIFTFLSITWKSVKF